MFWKSLNILVDFYKKNGKSKSVTSTQITFTENEIWIRFFIFRERNSDLRRKNLQFIDLSTHNSTIQTVSSSDFPAMSAKHYQR